MNTTIINENLFIRTNNYKISFKNKNIFKTKTNLHDKIYLKTKTTLRVSLSKSGMHMGSKR